MKNVPDVNFLVAVATAGMIALVMAGIGMMMLILLMLIKVL